MATDSPKKEAHEELVSIELIHEDVSFDGRQENRLLDIQKRIEDDLQKKKDDWEKEVQLMRNEFLQLYPEGTTFASDEIISDPMIGKRRGSTDVLNKCVMKTMFEDIPDAGRKFKLRFDCRDFDPADVNAWCDVDRVAVEATKNEEDETGEMVRKKYWRKIEKPKKVDPNMVKSSMTSDGILIVEAPLPPQTLNLKQNTPSPQKTSRAASQSPSPPPVHHKLFPGQQPCVPLFMEHENGMRQMSIFINIGSKFKPQDIMVSIVKDNRIQVKAKNEVRTSDRFSFNRFSKEFELPEKIDRFTTRSGFCVDDSNLMIAAIVKDHRKEMTVDAAGEWLAEEMGIDNEKIVNTFVLDLAAFPPIYVTQAPSC